MKTLLSLLLLSMISACASQKVYLFSRNLNSSETLKVQKELESKGYDVESNNHYFPFNINSNTLVHSFYFNQLELEKLVVSLDKLGFSPIDKQFYAIVGKHSFTKNSLGIYLFPNDVSTNEQNTNVDGNGVNEQDVIGQFESSWECANAHSLELQPNNTFVQDISPWEELNEKSVDIKTVFGRWTLSNNKVTLLYDNDTKVALEVSIKKSIDGAYMRHSCYCTLLSLSYLGLLLYSTIYFLFLFD